jgi:hypothetical protein
MQEFTPVDMTPEALKGARQDAKFTPVVEEKAPVISKLRQLGMTEIITEILKDKRRQMLEARNLPNTNKKIKGFRRAKSELFPYPRKGYGDLVEVGKTSYQIQANGEWRNLEKEAARINKAKAVK